MTESAPDKPSAGALLKAARERQGLHIAALAAAIKVTPRKLDALENDRWGELPDATFTRALAQSVLTEAPCEGSLAERIEQLVATRAAPFEQITAYYLSGETRLHASPTLQRARAQFAAQQRRQLLASLPEVGARPEVAAAVELLTSIDGWLRLRRTQGLSANQSRLAIVAAVQRLLAD